MTAETPAPRRAGNSRIVAIIVACAFFMEQFDSTVIVTALPKMAESFAISPVDLNIGLTAYMLMLAVFVPASGWIADRFGSRNILCLGILLFTVASVGCGISAHLWEFVSWRIVQGLGGALMSPVGRTTVLRATAKEDLVRTITLLVYPGLIGPMVGPPLGGFIAAYASWRWIFFINLPIGIAGIVLVYRFVANHYATARPLDGVGFLLNGAAFAALVYGMELMGSADPDWTLGIALSACGAVMVGYVYRRAIRHPHPLIDLSARKVKTFHIGVTGGSMFRVATAAPIFLIPLFLQVGLGFNAFISGLLFLAHSAGDFSTFAYAGRFIRWLGFRTMLIASAIAFALLVSACVFFTAETPYWIMVAVLFGSGTARSLQLTTLMSMQFSDVPSEQMSHASTLIAVVQNITRSMAVAFAAVLLALTMQWHGDRIPNLLDFHIALIAIASVSLLSLFWYRGLERGNAAHASGTGGEGA